MRQLPLLIAILVLVLARGQHVSASSRVRCWTPGNSFGEDGPCKAPINTNTEQQDVGQYVGAFEPAGDDGSKGLLVVDKNTLYQLSKELNKLQNMTKPSLVTRGKERVSLPPIHLQMVSKDADHFLYCSLLRDGYCEERKVSNLFVRSIFGIGPKISTADANSVSGDFRDFQSEYSYSSQYGLVGAVISKKNNTKPNIGLKKTTSGDFLSLSDAQREEIFRIEMQGHNGYTGKLLTSFTQKNWWYVILTTYGGNRTEGFYDTRIIGINMNDAGEGELFSEKAIVIIPFVCKTTLSGVDRILTVATSAASLNVVNDNIEVSATFLNPEIIGTTVQGGSSLCNARLSLLHQKQIVEINGSVAFPTKNFVKATAGYTFNSRFLFLADSEGSVTTVRQFNGTGEYSVSKPVKVFQTTRPDAFSTAGNPLLWGNVKTESWMAKMDHDNIISRMTLSSNNQTISLETILYIGSNANLAAFQIEKKCSNFRDCGLCTDEPFCKWTESTSKCEEMNSINEKSECTVYPSCSPLKAPENGHAFLMGLTPGSNATFLCNHNFRLVGEPTLTCRKTGQWSGTPPTCETVCQKLTAPKNGEMSTDLHTATFQCNKEFRMNGKHQLTCGQNGEWSASPPTCTCTVDSQGVDRIDDHEKVRCQTGWYYDREDTSAICSNGEWQFNGTCKVGFQHVEENLYIIAQSQAQNGKQEFQRLPYDSAIARCKQQYGVDARLVDTQNPLEIDALVIALRKRFGSLPNSEYWSSVESNTEHGHFYTYRVDENRYPQEMGHKNKTLHFAFACAARICNTAPSDSTHGVESISGDGKVRTCTAGFGLVNEGKTTVCRNGTWENFPKCTVIPPAESYQTGCHIHHSIKHKYLYVNKNGTVVCRPGYYQVKSFKRASCKNSIWHDIDYCYPTFAWFNYDGHKYLQVEEVSKTAKSNEAYNACKKINGTIPHQNTGFPYKQLGNKGISRFWMKFGLYYTIIKTATGMPQEPGMASVVCVKVCNRHASEGVDYFNPKTLEIFCKPGYELRRLKQEVVCENGTFRNLPACVKTKKV